MLRLTFLLCCCLGLVMLIGGKDLTSGERAALGIKAPEAPRLAMAQAETPAKLALIDKVPAAPKGDVVNVSLKADEAVAPAKVPEAAVNQAVAMAIQTDPAPVADPQPVADSSADLGVWYISGSTVNVRGGPSTAYPVLDTVQYGEATTVLTDPTQPWVKIRIEGDGVEGFVSNKFIASNDPQG